MSTTATRKPDKNRLWVEENLPHLSPILSSMPRTIGDPFIGPVESLRAPRSDVDPVSQVRITRVPGSVLPVVACEAAKAIAGVAGKVYSRRVRRLFPLIQGQYLTTSGRPSPVTFKKSSEHWAYTVDVETFQPSAHFCLTDLRELYTRFGDGLEHRRCFDCLNHTVSAVHEAAQWRNRLYYPWALRNAQMVWVKQAVMGAELRFRNRKSRKPLPWNTEWSTSTVCALARGIIEERTFDRMPILADALQDAGCEEPHLTTRLRQPDGVFTAADCTLWGPLGLDK